MPQMRIAQGAGNRGPLLKQRVVYGLDDVETRYGLPETRPAGTRFKFGLGIVQCSVAADAAVDSGSMVVHILPAARPLRIGLARHFIRQRRKLFLPFRIGLDDSCHLHFPKAFARR